MTTGMRLTVPRSLVDSLRSAHATPTCSSTCCMAVLLAALACRLTGASRVAAIATQAGPHQHVVEVDETTTTRELFGSTEPAASSEVELLLRVGAERDAGVVTLTVGLEGASPVPLTLDSGTVTRLVRTATQDPDLPLREIPLLTQAERRTVIEVWNDTTVACPEGVAAHHLIERQALATPDAVAVVAGDGSLTYAQLDGAANAVADLLRNKGIRGGRVAVCMTRSVKLVVALLAVWKAGAAYVPLDPSVPVSRLRQLVESVAVSLVITDEATAALFDRRRPPVVVLADTDLTGAHSEPPHERGGPADLAYVIHTSGSTGQPKAVEITHGSLMNLLWTLPATLGWRSDDVLLAVSSVSFDIAALELFGPLVVGGRVVLSDPEDVRDGHRLAAALTRSGATVMQATPSLWSVLLSVGDAIPPIRAVCGGERLLPSLAARLLGRVRELWNVYGPTETTIWSTAALITDDGVPHVGRPVANTSVYILDPGLQPVPVGQIGEVWIGGAGVARGYHGAPALTRERFCRDPFRAGGRMYRTGDLARFRTDGTIELHGRRDDLVKIRGHRVELAEVDAVLHEAPHVVTGAVVARERRDGSSSLVAFTVLDDVAAPICQVRDFLSARLPSYMVPPRIINLPEMPRTVGGKVDRTALHRREFAAASSTGDSWTTDLERTVAKLWCEVLDLPALGPRDNFFFLGGDSINAISVTSEFEKRTGEVVLVAALFAWPTVPEFARYLENEHPEAVARFLGRPSYSTAGRSPRPAQEPVIDSVAVRQFRTLMSPPALSEKTPSDLISDPAVFVLSAPRSGSTLLRVMLAGHPRLFVPPELELLGFDTMNDWARTLVGPFRSLRDGLLRAFRELLCCDAAHAERYLFEHCSDGPPSEVYRLLQKLAGSRLLVDKTTTYAMDAGAIARAQRWFAEPRYVHLVRHPGAMIASYEDAKLDLFFRQATPFSRRQLAELIWIVSNENVQTLRCLTVRFEDLVAEPEATLRRIAAYVGVPFDPVMLTPYDGTPGRMVDGFYPESRMAGDYKFKRFNRIEPGVVDAWRHRVDVGSLSDRTREIAKRYGYSIQEGGNHANR